ncbi:MAG: hypothetical protein HY700_08855, partial [Gemmatimonadetes bacterium]|nr:hypothetical protein [Gemmatimonadota bacterium]
MQSPTASRPSDSLEGTRFNAPAGTRRRARLWFFLAILALACDQDPLNPGGRLGRIQIELSSTDPASQPHGDEMAVATVPASHLDSATVTVAGATTTSVKLTKATNGSSFSGSVDQLNPGSYSVYVRGFAGNEVDYYGATASNVTVTAGQTSSATVSWNSFIPSVTVVPNGSIAQFQFTTQWNAVTAADSYKVEIDRTSGFASPTRTTIKNATTGLIAVTDTGNYFLRVRSSNPRVPLGRAGSVYNFSVIRNAGEPSDNNQASPTAIGFGVAATGTVGGLNIFPSTDVDWFGVGVCAGDSINVAAKAVRLSPPSSLNSALDLYNPSDVLITSNDDADSTDARIGSRVSVEGTFKIKVSGRQNTIGHYELVVTIVPGAGEGATACVSGTSVRQVVVTPATMSFLGLAGTQTPTAQAKDGSGNVLSGKTPTWISLNPGIATINSSTGLVTPVAAGQTSIAAVIDGVLGYAAVTSAAQPPGGPASTVASMPSGTTQQLSGIWGYSPNETYVAVGSAGAMLHYSGTSWSTVSSGTSRDLYGVYGFTPTDVVAVGAGGTVVRNGSLVTSGTTQTLYSVWGPSPASVFAVGANGTILRFNGAVWSAMTSPTTQTLYGVWGTGDDNVFAVGAGGTVLRYNGTAWTQMTSNTTQTLYSIWGPAPTDVFAVGAAGTIIRYNGTSWSTATSGTTQNLNAVWGTTSAFSDVYAAGAQGTLIRYTSSGWTALTSGSTQSLQGLFGSWGGSIFTVGAGGTVLRGVRGSSLVVSVRLTPGSAA